MKRLRLQQETAQRLYGVYKTIESIIGTSPTLDKSGLDIDITTIENDADNLKDELSITQATNLDDQCSSPSKDDEDSIRDNRLRNDEKICENDQDQSILMGRLTEEVNRLEEKMKLLSENVSGIENF